MNAKLIFAATCASLLSLSALADDPKSLLEEVVVVGAVRTGNVVVADVNLPGEESLQDMPVAYE